jgi:hypothetical protein
VGGDVVHRDPRRQPSSQTAVSAARSADALREGQVQRDRTADPFFPRPTHVFLDDCGIDRATENGAHVTGLDHVDGQIRPQIHFAVGCARDDPDRSRWPRLGGRAVVIPARAGHLRAMSQTARSGIARATTLTGNHREVGRGAVEGQG